MLKPSLALVLVISLVLAACSSRPQPQPAPEPEASTRTTTPRPTPVPSALCQDTADSPALSEVVQDMGFALTPKYIPQGLQAASAKVSGGRVQQVFQNPRGNLIIAYPVEFTPENTPIMQELGLLRPSDALSEIGLSGEPAYLMRGGWSDETVVAGPMVGAEQAEWDYGKSLTLFFNCEVAEGKEIGVAIQVLPNPSEWIDDSELIKIALSLARVLPIQQEGSG